MIKTKETVIADAREEEQRLEAEMFGPKQEDTEAPEESPKFTNESTEDLVKEGITPKSESSEVERLAGLVENLRSELADSHKRFNRFKPSADKTIYGLRQDVIKLQNELTTLREQNLGDRYKVTEELDIPEDTVAILGEGTAEILRESHRTHQKELNEIKRDREQEKIERLKDDAVKQTQENTRRFLGTLSSLVPDYEAMNVDQQFIGWLNEADQYGRVRIEVMHEDQHRGDAYRVAQFFNDYKQHVSGKNGNRKPVEDNVDMHRGPSGSGSNSSEVVASNENKGIIKQSFINDFNRRIARGEYKYDSDSAEAIEELIFQANVDGKILFDVQPI